MQKWCALSFAVRNLENHKKPNVAKKKKGYKSIPFTQYFETSEKNNHGYTVHTIYRKLLEW